MSAAINISRSGPEEDTVMADAQSSFDLSAFLTTFRKDRAKRWDKIASIGSELKTNSLLTAQAAYTKKGRLAYLERLSSELGKNVKLENLDRSTKVHSHKVPRTKFGKAIKRMANTCISQDNNLASLLTERLSDGLEGGQAADLSLPERLAETQTQASIVTRMLLGTSAAHGRLDRMLALEDAIRARRSQQGSGDRYQDFSGGDTVHQGIMNGGNAIYSVRGGTFDPDTFNTSVDDNDWSVRFITEGADQKPTLHARVGVKGIPEIKPQLWAVAEGLSNNVPPTWNIIKSAMEVADKFALADSCANKLHSMLTDYSYKRDARCKIEHEASKSREEIQVANPSLHPVIGLLEERLELDLKGATFKVYDDYLRGLIYQADPHLFDSYFQDEHSREALVSRLGPIGEIYRDRQALLNPGEQTEPSATPHSAAQEAHARHVKQTVRQMKERTREYERKLAGELWGWNTRVQLLGSLPEDLEGRLESDQYWLSVLGTMRRLLRQGPFTDNLRSE